MRALAKINLSLRVLGTRVDGYHELRTVFQSIALHDTLAFTARRGPFEIACSDPACPIDRHNLVWRAAARVWRAGGRRGTPRDVAVRIEKRIPMQAGLGGGSSNAAAALRAFAALWRVRITAGDLRAIAAGLGADVPFFLEGGTALGLERGDLLFPLLDPPRTWVVLVLPAFRVSTREAFGWWDADAKANGAPPRLRRQDTPAEDIVNDLQLPVTARHPEIARIVRALHRAGARHAAMSGSGSAVFGLFDARRTAAGAAAALTSRTRRAVATSTVNRAAYQGLVAADLPRS